MGYVLFNGRSAVHAASGGVLETKDICLKGNKRKHITYKNIAKSKDAAQTAHSVFVCGHPTCHKKSNFKKSTGDEEGDKKGLNSGTIQGKAEFISGSPNILIEGIPAVRDKDRMVSNNRNTPPAPLRQSDGKTKAISADVKPAEVNKTQPNQSYHRLYGSSLAQLFDIIQCR